MVRIVRIAVLLLVFSAITGFVVASDGGSHGGSGHGSDSAGGPVRVFQKEDTGMAKTTAFPRYLQGSSGSRSDSGSGEPWDDGENSREGLSGIILSDDRIETRGNVKMETSSERPVKDSGVDEDQKYDNDRHEVHVAGYTVSAGLEKDDLSRSSPVRGDRERITIPVNPAPFRDTGEHQEHRTEPPADHVPYGVVPFASIPAMPGASGGLPLASSAPSGWGSALVGKSKIKGEHEPIWLNTDSSLILSPFMLLKIWFFLGFRRVERKNVLDHDERKNLYLNIEKHPGVDLTRLVEMLGLNKETARYHIKMLALNGKISGLIKQGIARYFPSREAISEYEKTVIHYLWIGTTKRILYILLDSPGLTRQAIAKNLGIAGPSVTWQMQRLAEDGLVEIISAGKYVRYFLTNDGVETLQLMKNKTALGVAS
jgi:predicted transcriptional regulator